MDFVLDIAPVAAFVAAYYLRGHDIYAATATLMVAMALLLVADLLRKRRISPMHGLSAALVFALGAATLILHNQRFIQWKPTVFFWIVSLVFVGSAFIGKRTVAEQMFSAALGGEVQVPARIWRIVNWHAAAFTLLLGIANLLVAFNAPQEIWVNFKFYGLSIATFVFTALEAAWLMKRSSSTPPGSPAA